MQTQNKRIKAKKKKKNYTEVMHVSSILSRSTKVLKKIHTAVRQKHTIFTSHIVHVLGKIINNEKALRKKEKKSGMFDKVNIHLEPPSEIF